MNEATGQTGKMLLHACCGPCSMEPSRLFSEEGSDFDIFYANSNIAPENEYRRRLETLREFAEGQGIEVIEGHYEPEEWRNAAGDPWMASARDEASKRDRCRACYRLRFEEAAEYAAQNGYGSMSTTLSVSPYQYTDIICEELERACAMFGIVSKFHDFRPYYDEATRRSREAGMYRQNYCGCAISADEAAREREERREQRRAEREAHLREHADEIAAEEAERARKRDERLAYDRKRARQREILKELRESGR